MVKRNQQQNKMYECTYLTQFKKMEQDRTTSRLAFQMSRGPGTEGSLWLDGKYNIWSQGFCSDVYLSTILLNMTMLLNVHTRLESLCLYHNHVNYLYMYIHVCVNVHSIYVCVYKICI